MATLNYFYVTCLNCYSKCSVSLERQNGPSFESEGETIHLFKEGLPSGHL